MLPASLLIGVALAYMAVLFIAAYLVERRRSAFGGAAPALVYCLSIGCLFTGWSYFGTGSELVQRDLNILVIGLTPTLPFLFAWPLLVRARRLAQTYHVTTMPGFFALRYGPRFGFTLGLSLFLIVSTLPYLALQLQAIALIFETLTPTAEPIPGVRPDVFIFGLTLVLAVFAMLFGARRADPTERHAGVSVALAINTLVKLGALLAVTAFVLIGHPGLFADVPAGHWPSLEIGHGANTPLNALCSLLLILGSSIMWPHIFHLTTVESGDEDAILLSRWLFPVLYALLTACIVVIALAGSLLGIEGPALQTAVLRLPWLGGSLPLTLLAYLGGISAAAAVSIVLLLALANTAVIDLGIPLLARAGLNLGPYLLPLRWAVLLALALAASVLWSVIRLPFLPQIGMLSIAAIALLQPGFFLGLVWPRLGGRAVAAGLVAGSLVWLYTALLPAVAPLSPLVAQGPWGFAALRPTALFGLEGLEPFSHTLFWGTFFNLATLGLVTLREPENPHERARVQALLAGTPVPERTYHRPLKAFDYQALEALLASYLGPERASGEMARIRAELAELDLPEEAKLLLARRALERVLSGPLGIGTAQRVLQQHLPIAEQAIPDVMDAYQKLGEMLVLNREDLANRVRELSFLNAASERLVTLQEPEGLLAAIAALLHETFNFDLVGTLRCGDEGLTLQAMHGFQHLESGPFAVPAGSGLEAALRELQPRALVQPFAGERGDPFLHEENLKTLVLMPIALGGRALGALLCGARSEALFITGGFLNLLKALANELAIALSNAQLRERGDLLRRQLEVTLDNLADAVIVVDRHERIVLVNDAFVDLFEADDRDAVSRHSLHEFIRRNEPRTLDGSPIVPETYPERIPTYRALSGQASSQVLSVRTLGGRERILSISSTPVRDAAGQVLQAVTVYRDLSELYALQAQLEERVRQRTEELADERDRLRNTNEKLEAAVADLKLLEQLKGTFINAISHDLRIPLTGIIGYAEFIQDGIGGEPTEHQTEYAAEIIRAARRMNRLLNDLLDFARMEAGSFKIQPQPLAYPALMEQALYAFRPLFAKKRLHIDTDIPLDLPHLEADADRLTQVLANLFSNAIKFTPEGGRLSVRAFAEPGAIVTEVSDSGVGISEADLPHMFERFFQTEAGHAAGGTGIGLSITKAIIEAHGGSIGVRSKLGEGATFFFRLPLRSDTD